MLAMQIYSSSTNSFSVGEITKEDINSLESQQDCPICLCTLQGKDYQITKTPSCPKDYYFHFSCMQEYVLSGREFHQRGYPCPTWKPGILKIEYTLKAFSIDPITKLDKTEQWFSSGKNKLEASSKVPTELVPALKFLRMAFNGGRSEAKPLLAEAEFREGKRILEHARKDIFMINEAITSLRNALDGGCSEAKPFLAEAEFLNGKRTLERARTKKLFINIAINSLRNALDGGCSEAKPFLAEAVTLKKKKEMTLYVAMHLRHSTRKTYAIDRYKPY